MKTGVGRPVGFVGLGKMGSRIAARLIGSGAELRVHDVHRAQAERLEEGGASWAEGPRQAADGADVVFLSLPRPADVEAVVTGPLGVLEGCTAGTAIVDLSTNSPETVRRLAEVAAASAVEFLDAPVSGGVRAAKNGTLSVMVGGTAQGLEKVRPLLDVIGSRIFHVGEVGAGSAAKLVNNLLACVNMIGVMEGLILGAKAGIDPVVLRDLVAASSGNSFAWELGVTTILADRLAPSFTTALAAKDVKLALGLAQELAVPVTMGATAGRLLEEWRDAGFADADLLASIQVLEDQAGVVVRGLSRHDAEERVGQ